MENILVFDLQTEIRGPVHQAVAQSFALNRYDSLRDVLFALDLGINHHLVAIKMVLALRQVAAPDERILQVLGRGGRGGRMPVSGRELTLAGDSEDAELFFRALGLLASRFYIDAGSLHADHKVWR